MQYYNVFSDINAMQLMFPVMNRFIKSVPLLVTVGILAIVWYTGDAEYTNMAASSLCASLVFMLAAIVYIILDYFKQSLMPARHYVVVMFAAGLITFAVLYVSLEYFYA